MLWIFGPNSSPPPSPQPPPSPSTRQGFRPNQNSLLVGKDAAKKEIVSIPLQGPIELDGLTVVEITRLRHRYVNDFRDLVKGDYGLWHNTFGAIEDKKPWWGIEGQFCYGYGGEKSIAGPSEESRFLINPFLLLGLLEGKAYISMEKTCFPVYPQPVSLQWNAKDSLAVVTYDMKRFFREKARHPARSSDDHENVLSINDYNARDFGFNYIYCSPQESKGIAPVRQPSFLQTIVPLRSLIHLGQSCGYPGGCNNASPYQPDLYFSILEVPGQIHCTLWKSKPNHVEEPGDFTFIIKFE